MSEIEILNTHQLWNLMETAFVRPRSINFDNHVFLTTIQLHDDSIEHFIGELEDFESLFPAVLRLTVEN